MLELKVDHAAMLHQQMYAISELLCAFGMRIGSGTLCFLFTALIAHHLGFVQHFGTF